MIDNKYNASHSLPSERIIVLAAQGTIITFLVQAALGALFLALLSQWALPLTPVPVTLQTLGIFLLPMLLGGEKAFASAVFYLLMATMGLAVLSGGASNPLWLLAPTAGFLVSFPLAALLIGRLMDKQKTLSFFELARALFYGQLLIWALGAGWLAFFVGLNKAFFFGIYPFIPGSAIKIALALLIYYLCIFIKKVAKIRPMT